MEPRQHEGIDRVAHGGGDHRHLRADRREIRPVPLELRAGGDPPPEGLDLGGREPFATVGRGHDGVGIGGCDPGQHDA